MNKELFSNENILGLKDPNRPFPTGQAGDAAGVGLLKWRMQSQDESLVPLQSAFKSFCYHVYNVSCIRWSLNINLSLLQSTVGPLFLEMKLMSTLNMMLPQCSIYETSSSPYHFQLSERLQM